MTLVPPVPVDALDLRNDILRTLPEAEFFVATANITAHDGRETLYFLYRDGALTRHIGHDGGILYDNKWHERLPREEHLPLYESGLERFIDKTLREKATLGYVAMDRTAYAELHRRKMLFNPAGLGQAIALLLHTPPDGPTSSTQTLFNETL